MQRRVRLPSAENPEIAAAFADLRESLDVELGFPDDVRADAEKSVASPRLPDNDQTSIPFVTIDPPESMDLDQALHLERNGKGFRVRTRSPTSGRSSSPAARWIGAHERGQTLYAPDENARLYPPELSEGAGSRFRTRRARRSCGRWTSTRPARASRSTCAGARPQPREARLRRRAALARRRQRERLAAAPRGRAAAPGAGGAPRRRSAGDPGAGGRGDGERLRASASGRCFPSRAGTLRSRSMTGQAAAELMLKAELGVLGRRRRRAGGRSSGCGGRRRRSRSTGSRTRAFADVIRDLDPTVPTHAAFLVESTVLLRGSGYAAFDDEVPPQPAHAGVGAPYAHATAPLRRLVDRYVGEVCIAVCAGKEVPEWAAAALPDLPRTMEESNKRAQQYEAGIISTVEAAVLKPRVGETFEAVVVEVDEHDGGATIQLTEPAVTAHCKGDLPLGERVRVRLALADVAKRQVRFGARLTGPDGPTRAGVSSVRRRDGRDRRASGRRACGRRASARSRRSARSGRGRLRLTVGAPFGDELGDPALGLGQLAARGARPPMRASSARVCSAHSRAPSRSNARARPRASLGRRRAASRVAGCGRVRAASARAGTDRDCGRARTGPARTLRRRPRGRPPLREQCAAAGEDGERPRAVERVGALLPEREHLVGLAELADGDQRLEQVAQLQPLRRLEHEGVARLVRASQRVEARRSDHRTRGRGNRAPSCGPTPRSGSPRPPRRSRRSPARRRSGPRCAAMTAGKSGACSRRPVARELQRAGRVPLGSSQFPARHSRKAEPPERRRLSERRPQLEHARGARGRPSGRRARPSRPAGGRAPWSGRWPADLPEAPARATRFVHLARRSRDQLSTASPRGARASGT